MTADELLPSALRCIESGVPVLRATRDEIARMEADADRVSGNALSAAILRDPLMTLRVLRFLYTHRTRSQTADITTIAHALIMLGQARFFREFDALSVLEDAVDAVALERVRRLMSRSRLAALLARDWAAQRHDIDPEEIMVAALLHDVPQILLSLIPNAGALDREQSAELRARLFEKLNVPRLVLELNDPAPAHNPRLLYVRLACELARDCCCGWRSEGVAADLEEVQRFLHVSAAQAWERVRRVILTSAHEWHYYATLPAAAFWPFVSEITASGSEGLVESDLTP